MPCPELLDVLQTCRIMPGVAAEDRTNDEGIAPALIIPAKVTKQFIED